MTGHSRYHAPPVSHPAGRFVWGDRLAAALWCLAWIAWAWGVHQGAGWAHAEGRWAALAGALCLLAVGAALWRQARSWPRGVLAWRAGQWFWQVDGATDGVPVAALQTALDLQSVCWLRLEGGAGVPRWLCLCRHDSPASWDDLRRAVWATRRGQGHRETGPGGPDGMGYISRPTPPP